MKLEITGDPPITNVERFWGKVIKTDGCWTWQAAKDSNGYGRVGTKENGKFKSRLAHRVSWYLANGSYPEKHACHTCDNPSCVRPSHLFEGTDADNLTDMRKKGRGFDIPAMPGELNPAAKLDAKEVRRMREMHAGGMSVAEIHRQRHPDMCYSTLKKIMNRKLWSTI